jgi:hypothetical protein
MRMAEKMKEQGKKLQEITVEEREKLTQNVEANLNLKLLHDLHKK